MRIAFQGEPGAYSEAAALRFAPDASVLPCRSFDDVFAAVQEGRATLGALPMENSIGGSIHRNYDLLVEHELPIVGEVELSIDHCLLARPGVALEDLRVVYSHPQALAQCEQYLKGLPGVDIIAVYDTAGGAKMVHEEARTDVAAVASRRAAEVFDLTILAESIQDYAINLTRFVLIGRKAVPAGGGDQDLAGLLAEEHAGIAVEGPERLRAARDQPHARRVASDPRPSVGVPLLRGRGRAARLPRVRPRDHPARRVHPLGQSPGELQGMEVSELRIQN